MEDFRKAMYSACRQMDMEIVPIDIGARVMAYVGLQGGMFLLTQNLIVNYELCKHIK